MAESSDNLITNNGFGDLETSPPMKQEVGDVDLMLDHLPHSILQQQHEDPGELDTDLALKRAHDQVHGDEEGLAEDPASKRLKLPPFGGADAAAAAAAAKKINHEQWETMFARLVEYKEAHGDCLVPKRYAADPKLGTWVETQRVQYKRLEREVDEASGVEAVQPNKRLNQERLEKLKSIGFAWSAKNVRKPKPPTPEGPPKLKKAPADESASRNEARTRLADAQWEELYLRLTQYKEKHFDCLVPRKYDADPKLATWVETQRILWNRDFREGGSIAGSEDLGKATVQFPEPDAIPPVAAMDAIPPVAAMDAVPPVAAMGKTPDDWEEAIGKPDSGGATAEDAAELAATMTEDAVHVDDGINALDGDAQNAAVVAAAVEAVDAPLSEEAVKALPVLPRRLTRERKERLDALGFIWSLRNKRIDDHWDEMFRLLAQYKEAHGDCLVPSRYEANLKLGKWVETQRYEYTKLQRAASGAIMNTTEVKVEQEIDPSSGKPRASNPRLTEERLRRLESIGFEWKVKHKMKRYYDRQWDAMFDKLLKFKEENGHVMVPKRYPPEMKLGTWVHTQRIQYRKMMAGTKKEMELVKKEMESMSDVEVTAANEDDIAFRLTDERRKRLEEVDFVWSAREGEKGTEQGRITRNSYDDQWDQMFARLQEYKEKSGDCLVPKRHKEDPKLGTWVDTQRVQFKKMKKKLEEQGITYEGPEDAKQAKYEDEDDNSTSSNPSQDSKPVVGRLTDDRIRRLENLGFVWSLRDDWQKHYLELKQYKEEHGHCNVPARYAKNRRLGIWVSAQRQQYKIMKSPDESKPRRSAPLTQERIDLLNELGFTWTIRSRDSLGESWNERLQSLREYRAKHGNCLVPSRYPPNPELGVWVGTQRTQYRLYTKAKESGQPISGMSAMNEERIRQLGELDFVWALRGVEGKKEADQAGAGTIGNEAMQVAGDLPIGESRDVHMVEEVEHAIDDTIVRHAVEHAEIHAEI